MFLLGKSLCELWLMENILLQPTINSIIFNFDWASGPHSNPACTGKLPWSPKTKVNFCTLVCSPHLRLIYSLDHYFYVHLVFPPSLGHKFLGNNFTTLWYLSRCWLYSVCMLSCFNHVQLFETLWTVAHKAPLSVGFSRWEYWDELSSPPPRDLPHSGIKLVSLNVSCTGLRVLYH